MKILLVAPPLNFPLSPYLSIPVLLGQLKNAGYDATGFDINIEFYNDICSKQNLEISYNLILKKLDCLNKKYSFKESATLHNLELEIEYEQYKYLQNYTKNFSNEIQEIINNIDKAKSILKSKQKFYIPSNYAYAKKILDNALKLFFAPYYPSVQGSSRYRNDLLNLSFQSIIFQVSSCLINPYIDYYKKFIEQDRFSEFDIIGLSVPHPNQIVPAFTLAKILKTKYPNKKIIFGGNTISRVKDAFINNPEIFDNFIDGFLHSQGEMSIVEYAEYVEGKRDISQVSNLIYKQKNSIIENKYKPVNMLEELSLPSLEGYDLSKYFTPEIVFSIQASVGCYWRKCIFCDYHYGRPSYTVKSVEKIISELQYLINNFNIRHFEIIDEALQIDYLDSLCEQIIKKKLNIKLYIYLRLEKELNYKTLKKFKKAGIVAIQWGFESSSDRIISLMNKGIDTKKRFSILKSSQKAGIWNRAFVIGSFPTETEDEVIKTINTLIKNDNIIHSFSFYMFSLSKHAPILNMKEKFNITEIINDEEFSPYLKYKTPNLPNKLERADKLYKELLKKSSEKIWSILAPDECIFLYAAKYPLKKFVKMKKSD